MVYRMSKDEQIYRLWKLLDDIDTLDDAVKGNDKAFREHTRTIQQKRRQIVPEAEVDELYNRFYGEDNPSELPAGEKGRL